MTTTVASLEQSSAEQSSAGKVFVFVPSPKIRNEEHQKSPKKKKQKSSSNGERARDGNVITKRSYRREILETMAQRICVE